MTISDRIFQLLEERKLKQVDLAKHLGISQGVIADWRYRGNQPSSKLLLPISEFLQCSIYDLVEEEPRIFELTNSGMEHIIEKMGLDETNKLKFTFDVKGENNKTYKVTFSIKEK